MSPKIKYRLMNVHVFASEIELRARFMLSLPEGAKKPEHAKMVAVFFDAIVREHKKARDLYEKHRF